MDTKKGNVIYTVFLCIVIPLTLIFLLVPAFRSSAAKSYNVDYNTTMELGDYLVKISDAAYLDDKNEFDFMLSVKPKYNASGSYPEISEIFFCYSDDTNEDKTDNFSSEKLSEMSDLISAAAVGSEIKYVRISVISKAPDYYDEDKTDEFGDVIEGEKHEGKTYEQYAVIDGNDIIHLNSSEYHPTGKSVSIEITASQADEAPTGNEDRQRVTRQTTVTTEDYGEWMKQREQERSRLENSSSESSADSSEEESSSEDDSSYEPEKTSKSGGRSTNNGGGNANNNGGYSGGGDRNYYDEQEETAPAETEKAEQKTEPSRTETTTERTTTPSVTTTTAAPVTTTTAATTTTFTTTTTTNQPEIHVYAIRLDTGFDDNNVRLSVGEEHTVYAVISPDNAANKTVNWSSNKPGIASVDSSGKITANSAGKAIITASTEDGGLTASCMTTVE